MNQHLTSLLSKPMDRKEFLRLTGAGIVLVMGGGMILQALGMIENKHRISEGYGSSAYGGGKDQAPTLTNARRRIS